MVLQAGRVQDLLIDSELTLGKLLGHNSGTRAYQKTADTPRRRGEGR